MTRLQDGNRAEAFTPLDGTLPLGASPLPLPCLLGHGFRDRGITVRQKKMMSHILESEGISSIMAKSKGGEDVRGLRDSKGRGLRLVRINISATTEQRDVLVPEVVVPGLTTCGSSYCTSCCCVEIDL